MLLFVKHFASKSEVVLLIEQFASEGAFEVAVPCLKVISTLEQRLTRDALTKAAASRLTV